MADERTKTQAKASMKTIMSILEVSQVPAEGKNVPTHDIKVVTAV